jgi:uncharacterized membrane protein
MKRLAVVLVPVYPFAIWWALGHWSPRWVGLLALGLVAARWAVAREAFAAAAESRWLLLGVVSLCGATVIFDRQPLLLAIPVVMSAFLAWVFGHSLASVPLVERFASKEHTPEEMVELAGYCRRVTQVWCAFLLANAALCLALALFAPLGSWALYTGFVSYLLMGLLFAVEWCVRQPRVRAARAAVAARAAAQASAGA